MNQRNTGDCVFKTVTTARVWRMTRTGSATAKPVCGRGTQCETMHSEQCESNAAEAACMWTACTPVITRTATRQTTAAIRMMRERM